MNKDAAATSLGIGVRSLVRYQGRGWITPTVIDHVNFKENDYSEAEVERLRKRLDGSDTNGTGSTALESVPTHADPIETIALNGNKTANLALLAEVIASAVEKSRRTSNTELKEKMVLSLAEASKLSGIPPQRLKEAVMLDGSILFYKNDPALGRGYRVKTRDLIEYVAEF